MNVFGGATRVMGEGPRGPRGFRGKDSSIVDFSTWLPRTVINNLQVNDEVGAFFIEYLDKDLLRPKGKGTDITQWISRSRTGGNLVAKKPSSVIEKIEDYSETPDRYAMKFNNTHYHAPESAFLFGMAGTCGFICITFRTNSEKDQVLIGGPDLSGRYPHIPSSEIKVSGATEITIQIHGVQEIIQHSCKEWTTLFIEYNSDEKLSHFTYDVNGIMGSFTCPSMRGAVKSGFHLGCRWNGTDYLDGEIVSVETYENWDTAAPLPDTLKKIVIDNQTFY